MTTRFSLPMLVLTLLIPFAGTTHAKVDTVLRVIPTGAVGWVKVNHLADLIEKVDSVMRKVAPPGEEIPEGILLQALNELLPIPEVNSVPAFLEAWPSMSKTGLRLRQRCKVKGTSLMPSIKLFPTNAPIRRRLSFWTM